MKQSLWVGLHQLAQFDDQSRRTGHSMSLVNEPGDEAVIPINFVLPGILLVLIVELMVLVGVLAETPGVHLSLIALMLILPWTALLLTRRSVGALGFDRGRWLLHLGWGMVVGGIWRVGSVLLNLWAFQLNGLGFTLGDLVIAILWVPFVEETFFRAYIGRSTSRFWGVLPGILLQALLFSLMPSHVSQGLSALVGIFTFGVLAGWIMHVRNSLWAALGAHAFANLLPLLVLAVH
jgi:membrane protease YdiL (CAAX protease family)